MTNPKFRFQCSKCNYITTTKKNYDTSYWFQCSNCKLSTKKEDLNIVGVLVNEK